MSAPDLSKGSSRKTAATTKRRPRRPFGKVLESLRQVWQISVLGDRDALWQVSHAKTGATLRSRGLRVAVWNLWKGAGAALFEHDFRVVLFRSDLVLTQEALLSPRGLAAYTDPDFSAVHAGSYVRRDGLRDGVMTLARAPFLDRAQRVVCKYPEPIFRTPKVALISFHPLEDSLHPLMVVNIHATLVRTLRGAAEEMEHLIDQLPPHPGPTLLGGDFNTFTGRYLDVVEGVLRRHGLHRVPIPDDPRPKSASLDQVFVRGLQVNRAFVDTMIRNSDHFPIFLDVSIDR